MDVTYGMLHCLAHGFRKDNTLEPHATFELEESSRELENFPAHLPCTYQCALLLRVCVPAHKQLPGFTKSRPLYQLLATLIQFSPDLIVTHPGFPWCSPSPPWSFPGSTDHPKFPKSFPNSLNLSRKFPPVSTPPFPTQTRPRTRARNPPPTHPSTG